MVAQGQQEKAQAVVIVVGGKAAEGVLRLAPGREEGNRLRRRCLRGGRRSRTPRAAGCIFGTRCARVFVFVCFGDIDHRVCVLYRPTNERTTVLCWVDVGVSL